MHLPAGLLPGHREREVRGYAVTTGGVDDHAADVGAAGMSGTSMLRAVRCRVMGARPWWVCACWVLPWVGRPSVGVVGRGATSVLAGRRADHRDLDPLADSERGGAAEVVVGDQLGGPGVEAHGQAGRGVAGLDGVRLRDPAGRQGTVVGGGREGGEAGEEEAAGDAGGSDTDEELQGRRHARVPFVKDRRARIPSEPVGGATATLTTVTRVTGVTQGAMDGAGSAQRRRGGRVGA